MKETTFSSKDEACEEALRLGFTEHVDTSSSGDYEFGSREYFARPGAERNQHGWPLEAAVVSRIGDDVWVLNAPEPGNEPAVPRP